MGRKSYFHKRRREQSGARRGGGGGGSRGILPQESLKSRRSEMSFSPFLMRYFSEKSIS